MPAFTTQAQVLPWQPLTPQNAGWKHALRQSSPGTRQHPVASVHETQALYSTTWVQGEPADYDRGNCVDLVQLSAFMYATQPEVAAALSLENDNPTRRQFLARLKREVRSRGIIDVLRRGISHHQHHVDLFYGTPTPGNATADRTLRPEPFLRHPPTAVQQRRETACPRPGALHQRAAHRHLRAQEQPHQADGERRRPAVPPNPQPS